MWLTGCFWQMFVDIWRKLAICLLESAWKIISKSELNANLDYDYSFWCGRIHKNQIYLSQDLHTFLIIPFSGCIAITVEKLFLKSVNIRFHHWKFKRISLFYQTKEYQTFSFHERRKHKIFLPDLAMAVEAGGECWRMIEHYYLCQTQKWRNDDTLFILFTAICSIINLQSNLVRVSDIF